jgi:hypothetical protein
MADVTVTSGYPIKLGSIGMYTLLLWKLTDVDDTETLSTGLGTRIISFWVTAQTNPSTQGSAGCNVVNSSGTLTFYPGEDNEAVDVFVLVSGN